MRSAYTSAIILCLAAFCAPDCSGREKAGARSVAWLCERAEYGKVNGDIAGAIAMYGKAIAADPSGACGGRKPGVAYYRRGAEYYDGKLYDKAIADFSMVIKLDPRNSDAYDSRGDALRAIRQYNKAIADYKKALGLDPKDEMARGGIIEACQAGEREKAGRPDNERLWASTWGQGVMARCTRFAAEARSDSPGKEDGPVGLAAATAKQVLSRDGAPGQLIKHNQAADLSDEGKACYDRGDYGGAIINWNKTVSLDANQAEALKPSLIKAYGSRGAAYFRSGEYGKCIADLDEVLKLAPELDDVRRARDLAFKARSGGMPAPSPAGPSQAGGPPGPVTASNLLSAPAAVMQATHGAATANAAPGVPLPADQKSLANYFGPEAAAKPPAGAQESSGAAWLFTLLAAGTVILIAMRRVRPAYAGTGGKAPAAGGGLPALLKRLLSLPSLAPAPAPPPKSVPSLVADGKYEEARKLLARKDRLEIPDFNLFLEMYVKQGDYMRARLTAGRISQRFSEQPDRKCEYAFYLSLADACRDAGQDEVARLLRRIGVNGMLKSLSVQAAPGLFYDLAAALEKDGENRLALRLYQALMSGERPYRDSAERFRAVKERPSTRTGVSGGWYSPLPEPAKPGTGLILAGRYGLKEKIGEGGMGVVYEGWDRQLRQRVALKKMRAWLKKYPEEYKRFLREAKIVRRLQHPNIVGVQALVEQGDDIYMVFDFVDGKPLSEFITGAERIPFVRCRDIFHGVCEAVHYAHGNNVIHRDLKPENIMIDKQGRALVADFGLASELREGLTRVSHQTTSGTPAYMAPEQHRGIVKRESDIFALGVCFYETLTGTRPFAEGDSDMLKQKLERDYRDISAVLPWAPAGLDALIDRALEPEPSQRFADALAFYEALKKL